MLRAEERRERDVGILEQPVGGMREAGVDRRRVADEPDAASGNQPAIDREQTIDAGRDDLAADRRARQACRDCSARRRSAASRRAVGSGGPARGPAPAAERVGEDVAAESVERLAIVADEDDVAILLHDIRHRVPRERQRPGAAGEDRARAGEDQPAARLCGVIRHRGRRAEVTRLGADDAVAGLDDGQPLGGKRRLQAHELVEPVEHLALDLDFFLRKRQAVQICREGPRPRRPPARRPPRATAGAIRRASRRRRSRRRPLNHPNTAITKIVTVDGRQSPVGSLSSRRQSASRSSRVDSPELDNPSRQSSNSASDRRLSCSAS